WNGSFEDGHLVQAPTGPFEQVVGLLPTQDPPNRRKQPLGLRLGLASVKDVIMTIRGSCLCRDVQNENLGELIDLAYCHCSMCRRSLGAAFGTYARVNADNFRWLSGESLIATYESSPSVYRCFCHQCGSPLGSLGENGELSWVALGTVKGDPGLRPQAHIFVGSKAPWYEITDDLPQFDEWPPVSTKFFQRFD
ncbi:MAG: GFA family protein, partial [Paracoccaceae bacterium]